MTYEELYMYVEELYNNNDITLSEAENMMKPLKEPVKYCNECDQYRKGFKEGYNACKKDVLRIFKRKD